VDTLDASIETAFVDLNTLYCDIDLSKFKNLKVVFTHGSHPKFKITVSCPILVLEDCLDQTEKTTELDYKRVYDFEQTANRQQVLTYCQTSGSTG